MQLIFWLTAIILSLGAGYLVYRADSRRAVPYPWITSLLRSLVVFFTLLLILVPTIVIINNTTEKPIVLLLQDNSRSIGAALGSDSGAYRKSLEALTQRLSDKYKVVQWGFGNSVQSDSIFQYRQQATDISAALTRAQEFFGMQNLGAVVLATDGRFNQGVIPLYQQLSVHSPIYTIAIGDSSAQKDLKIAKVNANKIVTLNSSFEVRADVVSRLCKGYSNSITIKEEGNTLSSVPLSVNADKYDRAVSFTVKADKAGLHHYRISIPVADGEKNAANNSRDIFVQVVDEKKKVLIASASPHPDVNAIKDALSGIESYQVSVCTADNFPASLNDYSVIILHGLPSVRNNIVPQLLAARKPLWLITGSQAKINALNNLLAVTHVNFSQALPQDAIASFRPSFSAFTLPQQIQSVTDKMPPLTVSSGNIMPTPGADILFTQRGTTGDQPLWLVQHGNVPVAVLLGEGIWRWRLYEYKNFNSHTVVDECIRQTVAFLSANNNEQPFTVVLPKYVWSDQEAISLNAYLLNANNEQVNTAEVQLTIADSAGKKQNYTMERSGSAYALNIGVWAGGSYSYQAKTSYNNKNYVASGSFVVESMPLEFMETGADYPLLYSLSKKYNGAFFTSKNFSSLYDSIAHNDAVKPIIRTNTETVPLVDRKWYFFIILLIAVAEWLLRKYWLAQ